MNVLITGTGRPYALGFNLVRRYLEQGDTVFASIRQSFSAGLKNWQALGVLLAACLFAAVVSTALALLPVMILDSSLLTAILFGLLFGCLWAFLAIAGYFATRDVFGKEE